MTPSVFYKDLLSLKDQCLLCSLTPGIYEQNTNSSYRGTTYILLFENLPLNIHPLQLLSLLGQLGIPHTTIVNCKQIQPSCYQVELTDENIAMKALRLANNVLFDQNHYWHNSLELPHISEKMEEVAKLHRQAAYKLNLSGALLNVVTIAKRPNVPTSAVSPSIPVKQKVLSENCYQPLSVSPQAYIPDQNLVNTVNTWLSQLVLDIVD